MIPEYQDRKNLKPLPYQDNHPFFWSSDAGAPRLLPNYLYLSIYRYVWWRNGTLFRYNQPPKFSKWFKFNVENLQNKIK